MIFGSTDIAGLSVGSNAASKAYLGSTEVWAAGGGVTLGDPFVSAFTPTATRNNFTGWVGYSFVVGGSPIDVNGLGRWVLSGNSGSRTVKLTDISGTELASVTLDLSAFSSGGWASQTISAVTLSASTTYAIQCYETSGSDTWHDVNTSFTIEGVASTIRARYASNSSQTWANVDYIADFMYVPTTFFFAP